MFQFTLSHSLTSMHMLWWCLLQPIDLCCTTKETSYSGFPRAQTKNQKERGEPGRIYDARNVTGRENLFACGLMNELAVLLTEKTCSVAYGQQNRTRWHYAAGKLWWAYTDPYIWKSRYLTCLPGKLTAVHPGEWLSRCTKVTLS